MGSTLSTLIRLAFGAMDLGSIQSMAEESPLLLVAPRLPCLLFLLDEYHNMYIYI